MTVRLSAEIVVLGATLGLAALVGQSQVTQPVSEVSGTVFEDIAGAVVPGCTVVFESDSEKVVSHTDEDGSVRVSLPSGTYTVTTTSLGFVTSRLFHLQIHAPKPVAFRVVLKVNSTPTDGSGFDGVPTADSELPSAIGAKPSDGSSRSLTSNDASGRFSPHCDGASFYLTKVDGLSSGQSLVLTMRHSNISWRLYRPQETWENVYAERCASTGRCEAATRARIWLNKVGPKDKRVSGKYEVDFPGQQLAGQFLVKYRRDKTWICE
jgi:hypothetical protein